MREAGLLEAEEATRLTTDEHRSRLTGAEAEAQTADGKAIYDVYNVDAMSICDEALHCDDNDDELAAATTTVT